MFGCWKPPKWFSWGNLLPAIKWFTVQCPVSCFPIHTHPGVEGMVLRHNAPWVPQLLEVYGGYQATISVIEVSQNNHFIHVPTKLSLPGYYFVFFLVYFDFLRFLKPQSLSFCFLPFLVYISWSYDFFRKVYDRGALDCVSCYLFLRILLL